MCNAVCVVPGQPQGGITSAPTTSACPECGAALGAGAVLCIECGYDLRTGKRRKTKKRRLQLVWDDSLSLPGRIILGALLALAGVGVGIAMLSSGQHAAALLALPLLLLAGLFASPYGYVDRLAIRRDRSGKLVLSKLRWLLGIPLANWSRPLAGFSEAWTDYAGPQNPGEEGAECYWLTIRGDRERELVVYSGPDGDRMRDIADALRAEAGLTIRRK
jgi:hypothetical protein